LAGGGSVELRKDPITQSWVIQVPDEGPWPSEGPCPLCPGQEALCPKTIYEYPFGQGEWQVRVVPHLRPLYRIEGEAQRRGEGLYDKMRNLGAHEIVIEGRDHHATLTKQSNEQIAQVIRAAVTRIDDLKKDRRFRYVTLFRNQGKPAGQDLEHPHCQITATPFIPRRVGYELRSSRRHYDIKERCLLCDVLKQEMTQQTRTVEWDDLFVAFCPFASRVPYETWILPLNHHHSFEEDITSWESQLHLAKFFKSVLRRFEALTPTYHLVLHTAPNVHAKFEKTDNWKTLAVDYHWHVEILPVIAANPKPYSLKEVYYNSLYPEVAALELRKLGASADTK
jgi:UDPglucose--hexose-1-phosphate uridylyltransferase